MTQRRVAAWAVCVFWFAILLLAAAGLSGLTGCAREENGWVVDPGAFSFWVVAF